MSSSTDRPLLSRWTSDAMFDGKSIMLGERSVWALVELPDGRKLFGPVTYDNNDLMVNNVPVHHYETFKLLQPDGQHPLNRDDLHQEYLYLRRNTARVMNSNRIAKLIDLE